MTLVIEKMHIMQAIDWSRFDLEGWLYQFGAWLYSHTGSCGQSINPIAIAMDNAAKTRRAKKLTKKKRNQVIADYISNDYEPTRPKRSKTTCEINDNEARAVQRLILDILGQSEVMDEWLDAVIDRYFRGQSWSEMANDDRTQNDARQDVKCGLATLHCKYGFIRY
ncbi:conserved hypothetical protein [Acinetobacter proteolyticus]|uniref:Phage antitermination protein Q n=1 Tax=Acinetobacter proteolyticus TaxID=1776741 RepID=A0A653K9A5_9GAMM|nr:hypothetical protein [Acinetobacter proteolyticus]VXA57322.1 conserved hypothetical protein [Acinetobacter proteolyticus]